MTSNRLNKILIVDSIPIGEINTAANLFQRMKEVVKLETTSSGIQLARIESANEFLEILEQCRCLAVSDDISPLLHIECHGDEDGLQFADGSLLDWPELRLPFVELNLATKLNLMVVVAACSGAAIAKMVSVGERAPFWGMIGPTVSVTPSQLEEPFKEFYSELLCSGSPQAAIEVFEKSAADLYWRSTAQGLFEAVWRGYKEHLCTPEALRQRAARMNSRAPHLTEEKCLELLRTHEPQSFERFRTTFFMCDLYPENEKRFQLQYSDLE